MEDPDDDWPHFISQVSKSCVSTSRFAHLLITPLQKPDSFGIYTQILAKSGHNMDEDSVRKRLENLAVKTNTKTKRERHPSNASKGELPSGGKRKFTAVRMPL